MLTLEAPLGEILELDFTLSFAKPCSDPGRLLNSVLDAGP
jgi:hypothetical protein